jgi:hypothetical protein
MQAETKLMPLARLHILAAAFDFAGLALVLAQAFWFVPPEQADHRALVLTLCVIPIALVIFLLVPRRGGLLRETETPQRSLLVYVTLGSPLVVTLSMLLLVAVSRSYDSFAGFGLLLAADAGRNLCEWLRSRRP